MLRSLGDWLKSLGKSISSLFVASVDTETGIFTTFFSVKDDINAFVANLHLLSDWQIDPKWKTRVINVPRAVDGIKELIEIITHGLRDKFQELEQSVQTIVNTIEGQRNPPPDDGAGGLANVQEKLASIKLAMVNFQNAFHTALALEQMIIDIKQRISTLDDLFLPQGNPKQFVDVHYAKRQR